MSTQFTRRNLLKTSVAASLAASTWMSQLVQALEDPERLALFSHGVASGDPTPNGLVIWTRVSSPEASFNVGWQVATESTFRNLVASGEAATGKDQDNCVKIDVKGLQPGKQYFYRFNYQGKVSEPGRTRTLPIGDVSKLCIALASCSNYAFGYFNAYEQIAADKDVEFVLHLGDYLYEYGVDGWGGEESKKLGREHQPAHEIKTLADYRQRHAQYKADIASRMLHAAHPMICIWDDHESANNPYIHGAQNHQPDEGKWYERRNAATQAYFEWMPVRDPKPGMEKIELWRSFEFGNLATLITLETRHTGREEQVDYYEYLPNIKTPEDRQVFLDKVMGNPQRDMLSPAMKDFYRAELGKSVEQKKPWRLIGNQIPMARIFLPDVADIAKKLDDNTMGGYLYVGQLNLPWYSDTWDGYAGAREQFYQMTQQAGASDLLVLTGDSHSFWANELHDASGKKMGVELGTTGISSPGDFMSYGKDVATEMDKRLAKHNNEVVWTNGIQNGFIKLTVTEDKATADYITVSTVTDTQYQAAHIKQFDVVKDQGSLRVKDVTGKKS